ncbi:hypothetical protein Tco_0907496 [Tanacetum coccineum]|uniref:Uncharacterized protein n=1 Tax=Tanacetum coccineum TaxID=301880 RepID=A0ABQ5CJE8_9ASTR
MATHNRIYTAPSYTKNIFANMRRQGKDFWKEILYFQTMLVQAQEEKVVKVCNPLIPITQPLIPQPSSSSTPKGNKSWERLLKMKKKDQISFDEQEAIRLQAEFDEEVRLAREKDEANVALIEEWNDIQANIKANQLLAERLQAH